MFPRPRLTQQWHTGLWDLGGIRAQAQPPSPRVLCSEQSSQNLWLPKKLPVLLLPSKTTHTLD